MSMFILFESRYALKERYNIGNVGKTASKNIFTLFESRTCKRFSSMWSLYMNFTFKQKVNIKLMMVSNIHCNCSIKGDFI